MCQLPGLLLLEKEGSVLQQQTEQTVGGWAGKQMLSLIPGRGGGQVTAPIGSRNSQMRRGSVLNSPPSQMSLLVWS